MVRNFFHSIAPNLYLRAARLYRASDAARRMGWVGYRRLRRIARGGLGEPATPLRLPGIASEIFVRPGTTDAIVFEDVLLRHDYGCLPAEIAPRFILDAGANAGFASVFFLNRYPQANIVAIEPDSANFAMVQKNTAAYGDRVRAVKAAVWPTSTNLRVQMSERADGITVVPVGPGEPFDCVGVDPLTLLHEAGAERIDIFKCDIEGGEEPLFSQSPDAWLERTAAIMVEIHSQAAHAAVYGATARHRFRSFRYRELHVFAR